MAPPAAAPEMLPPGTMLGRYEIIRTIGGSGIVRVYQAIHRGLERPVAVKVPSPLPVAQREARTRFFQESELSARVRHPNLVDVIEVVSDGPVGYVVMELLDGEDLAQLIARDAPLPVDTAVEALLPAAAAIAAAHDAGVIHRGLTPGNIFLSSTPDGFVTPKVLNLGISKIAGIERTMALSDAVDAAGTSSYLAPEQVRDSRSADARSDQYALGTILYECLTGRRAFEGENQFATLRIISAGACPAARSWRPELPARLDAVIARSLSLEPAARFSSVRRFAAALLEFASPEGAEVWRPFFEPASTATGRASMSPPAAATFASGAMFRGVSRVGSPVVSRGAAPGVAPSAPAFASSPRASMSPRAFEESPLPEAKVGGTLVLPDQEPPRRSGSRSSRPSQPARRSTRETGRRSRPSSSSSSSLAPPRRSSFAATLTPAVTLLVVAALLLAADRWGIDLWREYLPTAVPGSSADETEEISGEPAPRRQAGAPPVPAARLPPGLAGAAEPAPAAASPRPSGAATESASPAPALSPSSSPAPSARAERLARKAAKARAKAARRHHRGHGRAPAEEATTDAPATPEEKAEDSAPLPENQ